MPKATSAGHPNLEACVEERASAWALPCLEGPLPEIAFRPDPGESRR